MVAKTHSVGRSGSVLLRKNQVYWKRLTKFCVSFVVSMSYWRKYYAKNREKRALSQKLLMRKRRATLSSLSWHMPKIEGIDGETQNGKYVLLASSDRAPLYKPQGISALEFIDYLLEAPKGTVLCGYVTHYDVTKGLLSGLSEGLRKTLIENEWVTFTRFDKPTTIRIHYIPHRTLEIWECNGLENPNQKYVFEISDKKRERPIAPIAWDLQPAQGYYKSKRRLKVQRYVILYSVERFSSAGPFLECMENFGFDLDKSFMNSMKNLRGWSLWDEVPQDVLMEYNFSECCMTKGWLIEVIFFYHFNGIDLTRYNGYGSAAAKMLRGLKAKEHFQQPGIFTITELSKLFVAGRSELFRNGEIKDVFYYDLKNAYVTALSLIPSLASEKVRWQEIKYPSLEDLEYFGVSRVSWKPNSKTNIIWGPLPLRDTNGAIYFPLEGSGLYHNIEVLEAIARNNWDISVEWTRIAVPYEPDYSKLEDVRKGWYEYPFEKVRSMVDVRAIMKNAISSGKFELEGAEVDEFTRGFLGILEPFLSQVPSAILDLYKGMGNSCYGKLAEKPHGKKLPAYNNLLFASFITSWCRSQLLRHLDPDSIIMTATDSLICAKPIFGDNLKDGYAVWDLKKRYSHGFFLVAGVYQLGDLPNKPYHEWNAKERELFKTRGIPAEELLTVWDQFKTGEKKRHSVDVPMLCGWKVFYTRSEEWLKAYRAKYGHDFKADDWVPITKSLSADSNKKRDFRGGNKYIPSIPAVPNTIESQPERKYRVFSEIGVSDAQLEALVKA